MNRFKSVRYDVEINSDDLFRLIHDGSLEVKAEMNMMCGETSCNALVAYMDKSPFRCSGHKNKNMVHIADDKAFTTYD